MPVVRIPTEQWDAQPALAAMVLLMRMIMVSSCAVGSWGGRIADRHSPVGPEATRGSAASPSLPRRGVHPAGVAAADVGV